MSPITYSINLEATGKFATPHLTRPHASFGEKLPQNMHGVIAENLQKFPRITQVLG